MNKENVNISHKLERIQQLADGLSIAKYNLLKINYLNKLVAQTELNAVQCETCQANNKTLSDMIEKIPKLDDIEIRQPYEKNFNQIRSHFHSEHGFIPPHYYSSRYSVVGIVVGAGVPAAFSLMFLNGIIVDLLLAGFVAGLALGYFVGSLKEKKYIRQKKVI